MSLVDDIIAKHMPDFDFYLRQGETLDDIDDYGFTPLIECAITNQPKIAEQLLIRGANVNKPDVASRTPLHWAVDNSNLELVHLFLKYGANPNAYTRTGLSVLVYPVLRGQDDLKHLLYQHGAKLDFALDFITGKLLGHRYELKGYTDIINGEGEFVELDFEGFILEFTVAIIKDALRRFISSFSTRHLRAHFPFLHTIMDAFALASELLLLQHKVHFTKQDLMHLNQLLQSELLIFPAASRGHALGFVRYKNWWGKIDRGENSLSEGSVNIYRMTHPEQINVQFIQQFLYKRQSRDYFHRQINNQLGLVPICQMPVKPQITGNCSWANMQAIVPVAYAMQQLDSIGVRDFSPKTAMKLYDDWVEWDKDRALDESIQRFYLANPSRQASIAAMLAAVLFQACNHSKQHHVLRAEKILTILTIPEYYYILQSYLDVYCVRRLTRRGNNLLKLLDDCGINPHIEVSPIATGLEEDEQK